MAKLTAADRRDLPKSMFTLPPNHVHPSGRFPIPDQSHARAALSGASRALHAGTISPSEAAKVRAKANAKLGK